MLIQGDSLSVIRDDVAGIVGACDEGDVAEAREEAAFLLSRLDELHGGSEGTRHSHPLLPGPLIAQLQRLTPVGMR
ncbi:DUF6959 family protein [Streptomyces atroolivaceus]|uniref:DUF6959 family protein n=1 Tax=Streptomyces atroolivaceus TaxID=66869 RepID=UPI00365E3D1E